MSPDNHLFAQCSASPPCLHGASSLGCLNHQADQTSPSLPSLLWESPSCLHSNRPEFEPGRLYSPSLLSSSFFGNGGSSSSNNIGYGNGADGYFSATAASALSCESHANYNNNACDFETAFCRDFYCCGITLLDLHDLLQHYEECHVRFEEEDDDEDDEDDYEGEAFGSTFYTSESECFEEEGMMGTGGRAGGFWSDDSDSAMSRSPSSSSPSLVMEGFSSGSSSHSENNSHRSTSRSSRHGQGVAAAVETLSRQQRSVFDQLHHPLYARHHPYRHMENHLTTHAALEAFVSPGRPLKRKEVVSLSDLYMEEDGYNRGDDASAFTTILRATGERIGPLTKRPTLEGNQHGTTTLTAASSTPIAGTPFIAPPKSVYPGNLFPGNVILGGNGKPIGPLSESHYHDPFPFGYPHTHPYHSSGASTMVGSVDWMRQRDEVFSILEDMSRVPSNASDGNKPYRCSVPGCDKAYKNPNGLKYHNQHGHSSSSMTDADNPEARPYVCTFLECGKRYKNLNGLKYHIEHTHSNMVAALRAHQAGLLTNPSLLMNGGVYGMNHQAAMTIAAALSAVEQSPMMAMAANAILSAHAAATAAAAAAATASVQSASIGASGDVVGHESMSALASEKGSSPMNTAPVGAGADADAGAVAVASGPLQIPPTQVTHSERTP